MRLGWSNACGSQAAGVREIPSLYGSLNDHLSVEGDTVPYRATLV
jgi:hypothetical protein